MVGLDARATMDLDATIKGTNVSVEDVLQLSKNVEKPNDGTTKQGNYEVYGVQFHPESILTPKGKIMLRNFLEI